MLEDELPTVGIIVLNHNGKDLLKDCLSSISKVDYPKSRYEVIIVDNASVDGSVEFVRKNFPHYKILPLDKNYGFAKGNNTGANIARGELLVFLNNDTQVSKSWLIELVKAAYDQKVGICTSKLLLMDDPTKLYGAGCEINLLGQAWDRGMFQKDIGQYNRLERVAHPCGASFLVKRQLCEKRGYVFDPDFFVYYEDADIGWYTRLMGYEVIYVPASVVIHKYGATIGRFSSQVPWKNYFYQRNMLITFCKNLETKNLRKLFPLLVINSFLTCLFFFVRSGNSKYLLNFIKILAYLLNRRKNILKNRIMVQNNRVLTDDMIFEIFSNKFLADNNTPSNWVKLYLTFVNLYLEVFGFQRTLKRIFYRNTT